MSFFQYIFVAVLLLASTACERAPVKIGLFLSLTGKMSELGVGTRQGILMAVEEINASGGINGRKVEMVVENSIGTLEEKRNALQQLIDDEEIVAIIGPSLDETAVQTKDQIDSFNGVFIAPNLSSSILAHQNDNLFNVHASAKEQGILLSRYAASLPHIKRVAILGDMVNATFVNDFNDSFVESFRAQGGIVTEKIDFNSAQNPLWTYVVNALDTDDVDAVLFNGSTLNLVKFVQTILKKERDITLLCASWSSCGDLTLAVGRDIDGTVFVSDYDPASFQSSYHAFKKKYQSRFGGGGSISFSAIPGYEAMQLLADALVKTKGRKQGLSQALTDGVSYKGLLGDYKLNEFGDVERDDYLFTIKDGAFVKLEMPQDKAAADKR